MMTTEQRSPVHELRDLLSDWSQQPHTTAGLYERLIEDFPGLTRELLEVRQRELLTGMIRAILGDLRRAAAHRKTFDDARSAAEEGESSVFSMTFPINAKNDRKPLRLMSKEEVLFVADAYERREDENRMWKTVMRAVARKMKEGEIVGDVLAPAQVEAIFKRVMPAEEG